MELADVPDSKSGGSDTVSVRPRSPAPKKERSNRFVLFLSIAKAMVYHHAFACISMPKVYIINREVVWNHIYVYGTNARCVFCDLIPHCNKLQIPYKPMGLIPYTLRWFEPLVQCRAPLAGVPCAEAFCLPSLIYENEPELKFRVLFLLILIK